MNMIGLDHKPAVKGLLQILNEWLNFRRTTVTRRLQYRLDKVLSRLHILEGLMIAFLNIDEVIEIIRHEDDPKAELMTRFNLSDEQADAILNLRLRHLAKLEEHQLRAEQDELEKERSNLETILGSERRLNTLIKKEIQEDAKKYASPRMSQLVEREEAKAISESEMTPAEPVTVILSEMGWVRCAKGHDIDPKALSYKAGDGYRTHACGKSNQAAVFIDSTGRSYAVDPLTLPSARSQGEPLTGKLTLPAGATVEHVIMEPEQQELLMSSDAGYGFICKVEDLIARNKAGKALISLPENAKVLAPKILSDSTALLVALTSVGRMLIFPVQDLPVLSKGKGNKIVSISAANAKDRSELLVKLLLISDQASLEFHSGKRKVTLKPEDLQKFRAERGRKGSPLPRGLHSNVDIVVIEPAHNI
ncbi:DNA topoisomerase IV subunit A [Rodentibacter pneumotropicus]|uniref:DNA topoisomerase (ATP-hydrolyzing) n=2 Tax=Rodentibacter pneumotropicus TaxID=758 RepID=A0A448MRG3_9PAST|nr:DNA topoisomerase IV subunit A [Rodentibacter pneumotropicus]